ncbi:hypothetical protein AII18_10005 [Salmonella enterica]|nr:hypothetical protein [Salmonella enterica]EAZ0468989.1 hypothetical protein [Salmonella enterica]
MPVSVVGVNISKTGNYTILITVSCYCTTRYHSSSCLLITYISTAPAQEPNNRQCRGAGILMGAPTFNTYTIASRIRN